MRGGEVRVYFVDRNVAGPLGADNRGLQSHMRTIKADCRLK